MCVLFCGDYATYKICTPLGQLVVIGLNRYDRLTGPTGDLQNHLDKEYHTFSEERCNTFLLQESQDTYVYKQINWKHKETADDNRTRLKPIIKIILFRGRNNLPLRGNNDGTGRLDLDNLEEGEGNFRRLLKFRVESGDMCLREQILTAPRNAR